MPSKSDALCGHPMVPTLQYPENVTLPNLGYFVLAPTLVYQMEFARTRAVRKRWLARRVFELLLVCGLMLLLVDQYVEPAIHNALGPLSSLDVVHLAERLLKLSLPCLYVWLAMFYGFFHVRRASPLVTHSGRPRMGCRSSCRPNPHPDVTHGSQVWLNILAECMRWADREFYRDWCGASAQFSAVCFCRFGHRSPRALHRRLVRHAHACPARLLEA